MVPPVVSSGLVLCLWQYTEVACGGVLCSDMW